MNREVDPCEDFYQFACGGWLNATQLPPSRARWTRSFDVLQNDTAQIELAINEAGWPLVGDFFKSCMNLSALDDAGFSPIAPGLVAISALKTKDDVTAQLAELHHLGIDPIFSFSSAVDDENPNRTIAAFDQGGLDLPRAVYLRGDNDSLALLGALRTYAATLFTLVGAPFNATANASAAFIVDFETQLANISLSNEARRDPNTVYNKVGLAQLQNWTTSFNFTAYTDAVGVRAGWNTSEVNVQSLPFYKGLDALLAPLAPFGGNGTGLVEFLAFKYISSFAGILSQPFRDAAFAYNKALTGVTAQSPRHETCLRVADSTALGELIGHYFVSAHFDAATKAAAQELVREAEEAFGVRMHNVTWLANSTDALDAAEFKLSKITNKIGYPDHWRSYSNVQITSSFANNIIGLTRIAANKDTALIDTATDKSVFGMLPQEINAYYQPVFNEIVFPAGILRGSFYNPDAPGALNYGAFGGVVSHEISHGFDDQGSQYDAQGRLKPWWPASVRKAFEERVDCVIEVYSNFTLQAGNETVHCNGNTTVGENLADMGGIANAFRAYLARLANDTAFAATEAQIPASFDKLTGEQLFFVSWGQNWCTLQTPQALKRQIDTDPHSPGEIRVLGPISQFDEFERVFQCKSGSKYAPKDRCSVW
jgi:putative endopeptidase